MIHIMARSYNRINNQLSSWEEATEVKTFAKKKHKQMSHFPFQQYIVENVTQARRSTLSSMFTDTSTFSPRSIAALRKVLLNRSTFLA